ncbi:uncharacterized protein Dsimw501_GD26849 [Drosophila simulans]|nr:uncharacterized protein Dsimw501_GD26849 [Drosophila simulans]
MDFCCFVHRLRHDSTFDRWCLPVRLPDIDSKVGSLFQGPIFAGRRSHRREVRLNRSTLCFHPRVQ